jgi:membrane protease YdiL (CAAX protease family)
VSLGRQLDAGGVPSTRNAGWMWLLYAGLGFLGGQVLAAVVVAVAAELAGQFHQLSALAKLTEPPTWYVVSTLCGLWGGFFGAAVLASRLRGTKHLAADLGIRFRWIDVLGIPIGVGGQFLVALMYVPIAPHVHDFQQRFSAPAQRLTGGSHGVSYAVIALATVVGAPFFEELFFRGVLLRSLARLFGRWGGWVGPALAIVVSGTMFGLAHAESLQLLGLATFGVILGVVSYRTGRLGMNMVAHASFNAVALSAVVLPALVGARGLA